MSAVANVIGSVVESVALAMIGLSLIGAALAVFRGDMRLIALASEWLKELGLFFAVGFTLEALLNAADGAGSLSQMVSAAIWWWLALRDPNGRWRRRAKKAAEVVRDIGHRLVVVPVAAPAGA